MRSGRLIFGGAILVFTLVYMLFAGDSSKKSPEKTTKLNVQEICDGKYVIIGILGKPCGELSKIRGVWSKQTDAKAGLCLLEITHIDGQELDDKHRIVISEAFTQCVGKKQKWPPKTGDTYEGRVYEGCGFLYGKPKEVERILDEPSIQTWVTYRFESYLYLVD
jgi:hypothetical protein